MKLKIQREDLLKPLQQIIGAVEKRQTMQALSNVLVQCTEDSMSLTATDLEIELVSKSPIMVDQPGETTLPARKLHDITKALPDEAQIEISVDNEKALIRSGKSRFTLTTLPASDFPALDDINPIATVSVPQQSIKNLIDKTSFAMAQQDVRYYLNGLLLELSNDGLCTVATDGHRLSYSQQPGSINVTEMQQVIIPRKGILELSRLLELVEDPCEITIGKNHIRITLDNLVFTSKLIDGRFPDYNRVMPTDGVNVLEIDRNELRQALVRASILSNEKYRGIRLIFENNNLKLQSHNPDQEEADIEADAVYSGDNLEIGINVNYMLDVLGSSQSDTVTIRLKDSNSSCLIQFPDDEHSKYVIMPMRL